MTGAGNERQLQQRAESWLAADPDPATRDELARFLADGDIDALRARFDHPLMFGTAGLRGALGAGPARMNRVVVRQTTAGLAQWILAQGPDAARAGLVVGRDARHGSDAFAADVASVAREFGIRVHALARPLPTPLTAFAVRHLGATAGVMITASHNPPADNGYKLYLSDGAQVIPPYDAEIADAAERMANRVGSGNGGDIGGARYGRRTTAGAEPSAGVATATTTGTATETGALLDAYRTMALELVGPVPPGSRVPRTVYTPVHGVGGSVVPELLAAAGFGLPDVVPEQASPDPDFPTAPFPNPEEPGVLDLALARAERTGAELVLANDPDADRLAVAVPDRGAGWRVLTGDELGILLADACLRTTDGPGRLVATTIVSSSMLAALASDAGVAYEETLTGFKWIARAATRRPGHRLVFGYEEALGYAVGDRVADKDGITAALAVAAMVADATARRRSILHRLDELAARLGVHLTTQWSRRVDGTDAADVLPALVDEWRDHPPPSLGGLAVEEVVDLALGYGGYPPTDGLILRLADRARVVLRPSGTEPKLKVYLEVTTTPPGPEHLVDARRAAEGSLRSLLQDVSTRLGSAP